MNKEERSVKKRTKGLLILRIDLHLAQWSLNEYERTFDGRYLRWGARYDGTLKNEERQRTAKLVVQHVIPSK
jgi:hypothetical protein